MQTSATEPVETSANTSGIGEQTTGGVSTTLGSSGMVPTACGDGILDDGEQCDDGNQIHHDTCTNACMLPTCSDGIHNGSETALDCGGGDCPKCGMGQGCAADSDCAAGTCSMGVCVHPASCQAIKLKDPMAATMIYTIDVDGVGPDAPFDVFCDMVTEGGGWALAFKFSAGVAGDPFYLWTGAAAEDPNELNLNKGGSPYVSRLVSTYWKNNKLDVSQVETRMYTNKTLQAFFRFSAAGSSYLQWMAPDKIVASSYVDGATLKSHTSIEGDSDRKLRFFINRTLLECSTDSGWMAINVGMSDCTWETSKGSPPALLYSTAPFHANWTTGMVGTADAFAVFIR